MIIKTSIPDFELKIAEPDDIPIILYFIRELARYEKLIDGVTANETLLEEYLFKKKIAEVIIAEYKGSPAGFALFYHNFSTFLGKPGIFLEDIYIKEEFRNKGFGRTILVFLAQLAVERDCGRMEWCVLDWNTPSIEFYEKLGAKPLSEWVTFRLAGDSIRSLAGK